MALDPTAASPESSSDQIEARILVTDDQPEMLDLMKRALGDSYECEFAGDSEAALGMLAEGRFELAICNVDDMGTAGLHLAERIVRDYPDTATVLMLTGEDDPEAAKKAFALGVYSYLVEPFLPGQLLITVMSALRRRELEIEARAHVQNVEDRRQTIIDMAPMPIYAKDASGRYVLANAKADELAGVGRGEMLGRTDAAIMPAESARQAAIADRQVLEEGAPYEGEESIVVGGMERTFRTIKFPLLDERGKADSVGGISIDVTADREAIRLRDELAASQLVAIEELQLSRMETIEGLSKALDLHDSETGSHTQRIGSVAAFLGSKLGLDPDRVQLLRAAAPMHDVGKIGTPPEILRKPGPLDDEERAQMQLHTVIGHEIFSRSKSELSRLAGTIALNHHEFYDGSGYPQGLAGEEIPLEARITAVADVFDALLSDRSYRPAMSVEEAVAVMRKGRGTHFDPRILDILLNDLDEALLIRAGPVPA